MRIYPWNVDNIHGTWIFPQNVDNIHGTWIFPWNADNIQGMWIFPQNADISTIISTTRMKYRNLTHNFFKLRNHQNNIVYQTHKLNQLLNKRNYGNSSIDNHRYLDNVAHQQGSRKRRNLWWHGDRPEGIVHLNVKDAEGIKLACSGYAKRNSAAKRSTVTWVQQKQLT